MNVLNTIQISEELFYEGELADGLPFGYGTLYEKSSVVDGVYIGYWNGLVQKSGIASERYRDGDTFVGYIADDIPNGYGEYYWKNGSYYKGDYSNGVRHGRGVFYDAQTDTTLEGEFRNGEMI